VTEHIEVSAVEAVLLADGWHDVKNFRIGARAFGMDHKGDLVLLEQDVPSFFFQETDVGDDERWLSGPMSSLLAFAGPSVPNIPPDQTDHALSAERIVQAAGVLRQVASTYVGAAADDVSPLERANLAEVNKLLDTALERLHR
jgi:hypothetical protein